MTFEEIQKTIEGMLAVQRELQEGQLKIQENHAKIQEAQARDTERFNQEIAQMMAVQRELQESQIHLRDQQERERETIQILVEEIFRLVEVSNRHENRINQLIGYSITDESDRLNLLERLMRVERRVQQLEDRQNN